MKRILAFLCVLALTLSLVPGAAFAATQDLQAEIDAGAEKIVLEADASNVTVTRDTTIDLNGYDLSDVTVMGGTLYLLDSQTADYTVADGVYGQVTNVTGNVKAAEGYLQVGNSFHAVNLDIYAMTLRAADVGVYYKSNFAADEIVAAEVESFGVALSVVTAPNASNLETYCGYSEFTGFEAGEGANSVGTSTLLKNIMKASNTDAKNGKNAAMPVYGSAYIKTSEGYFFGETVKRSLQEQVEAIDGVWGKLTDAQKTPVLAMLEGYTSVMENWNIPNIRGIQTPGADAEIEIPVNVTAENGVVAEAVTVEQNGVSITVPAGVKLAEGVTALTLTVTPKEESDTGIELEKNEVLMPMDVHVEGLAADNAQPLTIYLGKVMPENLNMGNYAVYHVENGKANEMTLIPVDAEFTAHNQYKYTLDGEVILYVANFSLFAMRANTENAWNGTRTYTWYTNNPNAETFFIRNADELAGFGAIVGGMDGQEAYDFAGKTVKLLADISIGDLSDEGEGAGKVFYPIGYWNSDETYEKTNKAITTDLKPFCGTFDGNGNTISDFYQNTWEMKGSHYWYAPELQYYRDGFGLFGYVLGATIKNLTVDNFSCDSEIGTSGIIAAYADSTADKSVTFENIAITNSNPRVYNIGNGGIIGSAGCNSEAGVQPIILKNITVDDSNKISALWGSWDVGCGGLVGRYYPNAYEGKGVGISFENCHVSATIDVYNDVCGNYQYYWYRYCGMVIGTVEKSTKDGAADLTGIVAKNCTVNFGDRHEYYYCEFVKNSIASYTHDYQFSRVDHSNLIFTDANGNGRVDKNEAASVTGCKHDHEAEGKEIINGVEVLKENNQAVYLPFEQLFGGNGWGIKGAGLADYPAINITVLSESAEKFQAKPKAQDAYFPNDVVTVGKLFEAIENANIDTGNVQVFVSPADETSTAGGTYTADTTDWTQGTLTFSGEGKAKITITDYNFCTPTTITVTVVVTPVAKIGEVEYPSVQAALDAAQDGDIVTLLEDVAVSKYLDIYTPNFGETERSITLDLDGHKIAPAEDYKYEWYPLVFVGINQTLTIQNGTIVPNEYVAVGVYGAVNLEDVNITREDGTEGEEVVCIWNWGEDDKYYQDCQYLLTGSATITGNSVIDSVIVEGPVTLGEDVQIGKLYLNTKTGHGKFILPDGYGLVKENDYYTNLHEHVFANNECTVCHLAYSYVKTALANIGSTDIVVITMSKEVDGKTTTWAMTNVKDEKSETLVAQVISVQGDIITSDVTANIQWNINHAADGLNIYPNGDGTKYLYCIDDTTGLRVGNTTESAGNNTFVIEEGYLYSVSQERYVGVFITKPDWRSYKLDQGKIQSNIADQTLAFYVLKSNCDHTNKEDRTKVEPTCTVAGHATGVYCLDCDTYLSGGELINANGHTYGEEPTSVKEAVGCKDGKKTYHCTVCNKAKTEVIKAPHNWTDATCDVPKTCLDCGDTEGKALGHTWTNATCTAPKTCSVCEAIEGESLGHNFVDGICDKCDEKDPNAGSSEGEKAWVLVTDASTLKANDKIVIVAKDYNYALSTEQKSNNRGQTSVTKIGETINLSETVQLLTLEEGTKEGTFAFYTGGGYLYAASSGSNYLKTQTTNNDNGSWKITIVADGTATIVAQGTNTRNTMQYNQSSSLFACYSSASQKAVVIYKLTTTGGDGGSTEPEPPETCEHDYNSVVTAPTCTAAGYTTYTCKLCGNSYTGAEVAATGHKWENATCEAPKTCSVCKATEGDALEHNYEDGTCVYCGKEEPNEPGGDSGSVTEQTVTMNIYANKGNLASNVITWTSDPVTFQNAKTSSSTAIRTSDSDHYRLYANSEATVSVGNGNITKIVFTCTNSSYATVLKNSIKGYTVAVSGSVVTVTVTADNCSEVTFALSAQSRINKIEVTYQ